MDDDLRVANPQDVLLDLLDDVAVRVDTLCSTAWAERNFVVAHFATMTRTTLLFCLWAIRHGQRCRSWRDGGNHTAQEEGFAPLPRARHVLVLALTFLHIADTSSGMGGYQLCVCRARPAIAPLVLLLPC